MVGLVCKIDLSGARTSVLHGLKSSGKDLNVGREEQVYLAVDGFSHSK